MQADISENTQYQSEKSSNNKAIDFTDDIVIIDDDQDDRFAIARAFKKMDADQNLRFFENGDEFLNYIQGQDLFWDEDTKLGLPKMVFVDMEMPIRNGVQTISAVKAKLHWQDVPIILVTGTQDDNCRTSGLMAQI